MELLQKKILDQGIALNANVLLVDTFLNHQVDVPLMQQVGKEFARIFGGCGVTRVATIESSGIAPASFAALELGVPLVIMKKSVSSILAEGTLQTTVTSFTKNISYPLTLKSKFVDPADKVLIIDDFLANGEAALGAIRLVEMAGGSVCGVGIVIEKAFQPGRQRLIDAGHRPYSLARVSRMAEGLIEFIPEDAL